MLVKTDPYDARQLGILLDLFFPRRVKPRSAFNRVATRSCVINLTVSLIFSMTCSMACSEARICQRNVVDLLDGALKTTRTEQI